MVVEWRIVLLAGHILVLETVADVLPGQNCQLEG